MQVHVLMRQIAAKLRAEDFSAEGRAKTADALDQLAGTLAGWPSRVAKWLTRVGLVLIATAPVMVVAGIWMDWRWAVTSAVPAAVGGVLVVMGVFVTPEDRDGRL